MATSLRTNISNTNRRNKENKEQTHSPNDPVAKRKYCKQHGASLSFYGRHETTKDMGGIPKVGIALEANVYTKNWKTSTAKNSQKKFPLRIQQLLRLPKLQTGWMPSRELFLSPGLPID
jgi:hypothetical protein